VRADQSGRTRLCDRGPSPPLADATRDRVQHIPDDAFYYLTLARNFTTQGRWSFDSGVSLTNGFHLLHAYALVAIARLVHPSPDRFVALAILLSALVTVPAWIAGAWFGLRTGRWIPVLSFVVLACSRNVLDNSVAVMEWPWVVSLSAAYCAVMWIAERDASGLAVAAAGVGFIGSLARTDFGLLTATMVAAAIVQRLVTRTAAANRRLTVAAAGSAGAAMGVAAALLHGWLSSGQLLQSSARMKLLWMAIEVPSVRPIRFKLQALFGRPFCYVTTTLILLLVLATAAAALVWLRDDRDGEDGGPSDRSGSDRW
jgi:hypothetical protein